MHSLLRHLRHTVLKAGGDLTDGQLLERYLTRSDEAAFEELVRRHGGMVLGVCRRLLRDEHAAEDAFQATFLVLVRKADSIRPRNHVGNWLYGVAYRTAQKARSQYRKRQAREIVVNDLASLPEKKSSSPELHEVIDHELNRLHCKYRLPLVLCDLEGLTRKQAAQRLGWPEGTVATRLNKARSLLAKRLARHGLCFSAAGLSAAISVSAQAAFPSRELIAAAVKLSSAGAATTNLVASDVLSLSQGVLQTMTLTKIKTVAVVFALLLFFGIGTTLLWGPALAEPTAVGIKGNSPTKKQSRRRISDSGKTAKKAGEKTTSRNSQPNLVKQESSPINQWQKAPGVLRRAEIVKRLSDEISLKELKLPPAMKLRELLNHLSNQLKKQGAMGVRFLVDAEQFKFENPDAPDVLETEVSFQDYPDTLPLSTVLRQALKRVPTLNATFLVRNGTIVITTEDMAATKQLLRTRINATFEDVPLGQALLELAAQTGVHIQLDNRVVDKLKQPVTVVFANNVTLESALAMLTDPTGLKVARLGEGLYVTTPENAGRLEQRQWLPAASRQFKPLPANTPGLPPGGGK